MIHPEVNLIVAGHEGGAISTRLRAFQHIREVTRAKGLSGEYRKVAKDATSSSRDV